MRKSFTQQRHEHRHDEVLTALAKLEQRWRERSRDARVSSDEGKRRGQHSRYAYYAGVADGLLEAVAGLGDAYTDVSRALRVDEHG